ncbi:uncharacterized protein EV420DRAFT_1472340 [Desarmillaria tabescens]|uniref:Uncharacterized protein n=1 Tax=Armillaria tabescens TaxID=1929756 RepID=A0AA39NNR0_ARMTA|nr:uncharacterized protein EV420DRAFT_1472340 [Desarmillaria tabescens]KAK0469037.1 hypothetical protein EV420DRAFT_1472340 [Desarmillaria tabescens]
MTKGKGKEKRIPVALHSELTEYSSLLRALRTESTLDVSSQISKHFRSTPAIVENDEDDSEDEDEEESRSTSPVAGPSSSLTATLKRKRRDAGASSPTPTPAPRKKKKKQKQADIWTKWPLLPEDLAQPQWGLEDEISVMVSQLQKENQSGGDEEEGEEDTDEDREYLPHLHLSTSNCLEAILATIAAHTPLRADSMQNRLNPIDWRFVLNVLVSQEIVHPKVIERAETRLRAMYDANGTVPLHASHRAQQTINSRNKLADLLGPYDASLFTLAERPSTPEVEPEPTKRQDRTKQKEKRRKRVSRVPRRKKTTRKHLEST